MNYNTGIDMVSLEMITCNPLDKESIINALSFISDEDLNGNNGEEYLWEDAKASGCKTNREYLMQVLRNSQYNTIAVLTDLYLKTWLEHDYYYQEYDFKYIILNDTAVISVIMKGED